MIDHQDDMKVSIVQTALAVATYSQYGLFLVIDHQGGMKFYSADNTTRGYVQAVRPGTPFRVSTYDTNPVGTSTNDAVQSLLPI